MAVHAFTWGADLIQGLINGIKSKISAITDAVSGVASKIKSFLHFSVPDEGPLTDYESWMPDFMKGLAAGIERNKYLVTNAVRGLANDMTLSPTANFAASGSGGAGGGLSQTININISANISNDMDIRRVAERLGQELQTLTAQNNAMQGAW
jgi:phage-related protein